MIREQSRPMGFIRMWTEQPNEEGCYHQMIRYFCTSQRGGETSGDGDDNILSTMLPLTTILSHFPSSSPLFLSNSSFNLSLFSSRTTTSSSSGRRLLPPSPRSAIDEEKPQQLEFDKDKARKALQQLDQQLQSLAEQQETQVPKTSRTSSPYSYSDPNLERDVMTGMRSTEDMPEMSRSYLSYSAVALLILTIFNNIIFNVFIKPSVDGNEQATPIERVPLSEP